MFDEMKIQESVSYHQKYEQVFGPHKNLQVVQVRGLCSSWKQSIYLGFDQQVTKSLLFSLIERLETMGIQIVAMVNDMGPQNLKLWKDLQISVDQTSFQNPHDSSRQVHVFADVPHLLKLLRNHLLDNGFQLKSGTEVRIYVC